MRQRGPCLHETHPPPRTERAEARRVKEAKGGEGSAGHQRTPLNSGQKSGFSDVPAISR
jgi:hypothetical protein